MTSSLKICFFIIACSQILAISQVRAQDIKIDRFSFSRDVSSYWLVYPDHTNALQLGDILKIPTESWSQSPLGQSTNSYWLKARVTNKLSSDKTVYFQIPTLHIDLIHFHVMKEGRLVRIVRTGESYPFRNRDVHTPRYSFRVPLAAGETQSIYIKIASPGLKALFVKLFDQDSFEEKILFETVRNALAFGCLLALAITYIILVLIGKQRKHAFYALWMLMLLLLYMRADGYTFGEFGRDIFWWNQWSIIFYCLMAHLMLLGFLRESESLTKSAIKSTSTIGMAIVALVIPFTAIYYTGWVQAVPVFSLIMVCIISYMANYRLFISERRRSPILIWVSLNLTLMLFSIATLKFLDFRQSWLMESMVFPVVLVEFFILKYMIQEMLVGKINSVDQKNAIKLRESTPIALIDTKTREAAVGGLKEPQSIDQIRSEKLASLGTLTNGLANELNNPLAIIAGHQYRLLSIAKKGTIHSQDILKSTEKIGSAVKRVISIVDALKVYSQDSLGNEGLKPINIRETVQYTLDLCRERLVSLGIKFSTQPIPDIMILANQSQIMQVLLNLIDNAVDAVSTQVEKSIAIEFQQNVTMVEIAVTDSGPGVPFNEQQQIFDPFYTRKHEKSKRGLGLSIASGIIARHQGKLFLDTEHPQTRFVLQLRR